MLREGDVQAFCVNERISMNVEILLARSCNRLVESTSHSMRIHTSHRVSQVPSRRILPRHQAPLPLLRRHGAPSQAIAAADVVVHLTMTGMIITQRGDVRRSRDRRSGAQASHVLQARTFCQNLCGTHQALMLMP